jgi:hypothetical protein
MNQTSLLTCPGVQGYLTTIKKCEKKSRDPTSLSYLIDRDLSQSACIRIGNVFEDILNVFLEHHLTGRFVRMNVKKNVKGERQKDILFIDEASKRVIYAELKANINLDTQKSKSTVDSVLKVIESYEADGYSVQGYLVSLRYLSVRDVPPTIAKKYTNVTLFGINDFITTVLQVEPMEELRSYETYSACLTKIADYIE